MISSALLGSKSKYPIRLMTFSQTGRVRSSMTEFDSVGRPVKGECGGPRLLVNSTVSLL